MRRFNLQAGKGGVWDETEMLNTNPHVDLVHSLIDTQENQDGTWTGCTSNYLVDECIRGSRYCCSDSMWRRLAVSATTRLNLKPTSIILSPKFLITAIIRTLQPLN